MLDNVGVSGTREEQAMTPAVSQGTRSAAPPTSGDPFLMSISSGRLHGKFNPTSVAEADEVIKALIVMKVMLKPLNPDKAAN